MHPLLRPARCIVPCIIVHQISQLSPHVLIQSMRTSFCIYRRINRQNTGYNYRIWAVDARNGLPGVILSAGDFFSPALFSLLITAFRGRNQRFIMECTLRWTIAGYRPQCEVSSKVSWNSVNIPLKVDTIKVQIPIRRQRKVHSLNSVIRMYVRNMQGRNLQNKSFAISRQVWYNIHTSCGVSA